MSIFITGASGYIGGSVAKGFADAGYAMRGLVRTAEAAEKLQALGIEPVIGSLDDKDLLTEEARKADAVINSAKAEDAVSTTVLLDAVRGTGKRYLQTSGTGIVARPMRGHAPFETVFDDEGMEITTHLGREARFAIDQSVIAAAQDSIHSIVICPPAIYGYSAGPKRASMQVDRMLSHIPNYGTLAVIEEGANTWSQIHIDDLVDLYLLAWPKAPAGSFYFAENGEASFRDIADALEARLKLGPVRSVPADEAERDWRGAEYVFGGSSRVSAKRARRELGWTPRRATLLDWIATEMEL